jgi:hypothetical protein
METLWRQKLGSLCAKFIDLCDESSTSPTPFNNHVLSQLRTNHARAVHSLAQQCRAVFCTAANKAPTSTVNALLHHHAPTL